MSGIADLLTAALAREIAEANIRVFAVTSPATVAAALAARELGAPDLAIATGFTGLDGSPLPSVTLGEAGLFAAGAALRDDPFDTFILLARGHAGVAVAPAQLDGRGQTNLSGVGPPGHPKVALPGARGLPDNNISPSRVWYMMAGHSERQLVERVDVVCGGHPPATTVRRLLTPAGCFELGAEGWYPRWITSQARELVPAAPGLRIELTGQETVVDEPDAQALAAVKRADPHDVRLIEFAAGKEAASLYDAAALREAAAVRETAGARPGPVPAEQPASAQPVSR
jgi:acyl CoA:acetate/3-ketoacid CoA transferase beta subunit